MARAQTPEVPPSWPENAQGRLMATMAVVASERGYVQTRVSDVLDRTHVSRRTFYVYFANRDDCFFATYDAIVADVSALRDATAGGLDDLLAGLLEYFSRWPAQARVLLIDVLVTGPAGVQLYEETMATFARRLSNCSCWQPGSCGNLERVDLAQAFLGGVLRIVQQKLVADGDASLAALLPTIAALTRRVRVTDSAV
jgi:TetR/AcrR family transcriptional regulator